MYLEIVLAFFIFRYLRKSLPADALLQWDKIFVGGMALSAALVVMGVMLRDNTQITKWFTHAMLLGLIYLVFKQKELAPAKQLMYSILPYIALSVLKDLVLLISPAFSRDMNDYFETATLFAIIWMIAMWMITRKQKKALEKEKAKTLEIEKESRIIESLKAALEVQVAERTAALTQQKETLQQALDELKATQAQLIQSEKMASLGELTAGIAHEIQNPLNFVNNFSEINTELIDEMQQEMDKGNLEDAKAIGNDIRDNEQKINHHGKRADAIVKGMLQHSRSSTGIKEATNINNLADEYLRLAYHGLRAKDKSFNASMKTDYDESVGTIQVIPQDIGRVILNLITNAFYAVAEKKKMLGDGYDPTVCVSTKKLAEKVMIAVKDNGNGIPQKVLDKIFQPFFTTKPTGQGTGLGLSMSYDIVNKVHGGEIIVDTEEGECTTFTIYLPV
ncbi:MAG: histidine kinase [Ferruginibacter sp.]|nr:histidine kinase [Ferruginibacter sp.]